MTGPPPPVGAEPDGAAPAEAVSSLDEVPNSVVMPFTLIAGRHAYVVPSQCPGLLRPQQTRRAAESVALAAPAVPPRTAEAAGQDQPPARRPPPPAQRTSQT
ncbi:hypothetical protein Krad_2663 [Kineococcus radiotolerans SRS30216 = ATCC BAA-149]|uniref:Uncharacterized protein n=1 Tax=Kineococcus radiotolerans (strain ATCC BAA-149 / DSM 14245 / SRS30216) TaxID=266940 RepID=A6WBE6_KINRD|nr:hypothetical protein Krad_2663 [Kineococcus radiotolerans SRS30216 = ATCC BAA-149]